MIRINGVDIDKIEISLMQYLEENSISPQRIAVELNEEILPKANYAATVLKDGDVVEIVNFVGGGCLSFSALNYKGDNNNGNDKLILGGHEFNSRFILGSGKYSLDLIKAAVENAGAEIITLALRRAVTGKVANILDYIPKNVTLCPIPRVQEMPMRL